MFLRNSNQANCLCNGTMMSVTNFGKNIISATIIIGKTLVRRYLSQEWIWFQRKQFPISLFFGMKINKNKGQSLPKVWTLL